MAIKTVIFLSVLLLISTSCEEQPYADFNFDKTAKDLEGLSGEDYYDHILQYYSPDGNGQGVYAYKAGETIKLTNRSIDAKRYKWTLPNGETSTDKNIEYTIPLDYGTKGISFTLEALSRSGKKTHTSIQQVPVNALTGFATFWQETNSPYDDVSVSIGNKTKYISITCSSIPSCGASGSANFELPIGVYSYSATGSYYISTPPYSAQQNWNGTVTVTDDGCSLIEIE